MEQNKGRSVTNISTILVYLIVKKYIMSITEHIGEMVEIFLILTTGLKFEPWECSCVML